MDHRKEIDRLYEIEYGDLPEFVFRLGIAGVGSFIHFYYTGMVSAIFWYLSFLGSHFAYHSFLRSRPQVCSAFDTFTAGSLFLVMLMSFVWLPAWLILSDDSALRISGTAATGALLIFLIHRADSLLWMIWGEIVIIGAAVSGVVVYELTTVPSVGAQMVMGFAGFALIAYFTKTVFSHRSQRLDAEAASIRSVQAQKMEAVGQLAGGVAHDFNNILTAVTGNLELYEVIDDPDERDQFVRDAHHAAERAAGLVRQLLAYSRKQQLSVAEYTVSGIFAQVGTLARRLLPSSILMTFEPVPDGMRVRVDQNQLITAMINLVVNARDAMGGAGRLDVRAERFPLAEETQMLDGAVLQPGNYVCLRIEDNGPGIPKDILRRVTEPFFTTKAIGDGSGLGLSMVEGFTRQSGGGMMIETSPSGTCIRLYLPCASDLVTAEATKPDLATSGPAIALAS